MMPPNDLPAAARRAAAAVDETRCMRRIEALAQIGGLPNGGVDRPAFSNAERAATDLFAQWMGEAGLTVRYDRFGNMFGSSDGNAPNVPVAAAGSHLDTVPCGGRYDGVIGCVGALETIEAMRDTGIAPTRPIEVVVWRAEEPYRFMQGRVGSLVFAGKLAIADLVHRGERFDVEAWLRSEEFRPARAPGRTLVSLLELHIEQGKRLEDAGRVIGIVTAISGTTRLKIAVTGVADHSGATPMELRHDALCAAAEIVLAVERAGLADAMPESVATTAILSVAPGAMNVVPEGAELFLDIRGTEITRIQRMVDAITVESEEIAKRRGMAIEVSHLTQATPVVLEPEMVTSIEHTANALGYRPMRMASGAGHDAQSVADRARAGMIFVPSVAGVSHAPHEFTAPEDIVSGIRVLAAEWVRHIVGGTSL